MNIKHELDFNPANICRITVKDQYYLQYKTTISGDIILGFEEFDQGYNVLGCDYKLYFDETKNPADGPKRLEELNGRIKLIMQVISYIPKSSEPIIDYYATRHLSQPMNG